jgi:hypothetical protein
MLWLKVAMCAVVLILLSSMFVEEDAIRFGRCDCPERPSSPPPSPTQARAPLLAVEPPTCQLEPAHFESMKKDVERWAAFHARTPFTADSFVNARNADSYTYLFAIVNNSIHSVVPQDLRVESIYFTRAVQLLRQLFAVSKRRKLPDALLYFSTRDMAKVDLTCLDPEPNARSLPECLELIKPAQRWRTSLGFDAMRDVVPVNDLSDAAVVREFARWFPDEARWANASIGIMRENLYQGWRQAAPTPDCRQTRWPLLAPVFSCSKLPACHADILVPDEGVGNVLRLVADNSRRFNVAWSERADRFVWRGSSMGDCVGSHMPARDFTEPQPLDDDLTQCANQRVRLSAILTAMNDTPGPLQHKIDAGISGWLYVHPQHLPSLQRVQRPGINDEFIAHARYALDIDGFGFSERIPRVQLVTGAAIVRLGIFRSLVESWMVENEHIVHPKDPWFAEDLPDVAARLDADGLGERIARQGREHALRFSANASYHECYAEWLIHQYAVVGINFTAMVDELNARGVLKRINVIAETNEQLFTEA